MVALVVRLVGLTLISFNLAHSINLVLADIIPEEKTRIC